jgi:hypothetical protein
MVVRRRITYQSDVIVLALAEIENVAMFDVPTFLEEPYGRSIGFFYQCTKKFQTSLSDNAFTFIDQIYCDSASFAIGMHGQTVYPALSRIAAHNGNSDKVFVLKGAKKEIWVKLHFRYNSFPAVSTFRFVREVRDGPEVHYFVIICCRQLSDLQSWILLPFFNVLQYVFDYVQ